MIQHATTADVCAVCGGTGTVVLGTAGTACAACSGDGRVKGRSVVDHPPHYTFGKLEVIDVIEDWDLGLHTGNAVKYIARAGKKGDALEDLRKARWYLDREIRRRGGGE